MKKKTKIIATSLMAIAMSTSLVAGGTYALFTSESKVNITVSSGKVDINAKVESLKVYSPSAINYTSDTQATIADDAYNKAEGNTNTSVTDFIAVGDGVGNFVNGGTATLENDGTLTLSQVTPGDKVSFDVVVTNNSNVTVQYQTKIELLTGVELFSGLTVKMKTNGSETIYDGMTNLSGWETLPAPEAEGAVVKRTTVTIELPADAGNEYQNKTCQIAFTVNAVQGNAATTNPEANTTYIYNASDLMLFARSVNNGGNTYAGKTVKLMNNVDLAGIEWTPIGSNADSANKFQGTFDGNGKTISNLVVDTASDVKYQATGFFGALNGTAKNFTIDGATITGISAPNSEGNTDNGIAVVAGSIYTTGSIEGVMVKNATVSGNRYVGGISGYTYGSVKNCTVENVTLTATPDNLTGSYDNGDKVGGVVGAFWHESTYEIYGNTVKAVTITGYRDMGGIVGYANGSVTNNTVNGLTLIQDYSILTTPRTTVESIIGRHDSFEVDATNTATNVTITLQASVSTAEQLATALTADADKIEVVLANNIDLPIATLGTGVPGSGQYRLGGADTQAIKIDLSGKNLKLTSTYMLALGATNSEATITLKNGTMSSYTSFAQTWNMYDIMFTDCNWVLDGVTFENAVAVNNAGSIVTMKNVTIKEVNDLYAIWVCAGTKLTMDDCTVDSIGRAIKISDQYVAQAARQSTTLTIKNTSFTSVKKAAILVGSTAGANITLENVDISSVSADATNAVWVDNGTQTETNETYTDYADLVTVTGGTKIDEP